MRQIAAFVAIGIFVTVAAGGAPLQVPVGPGTGPGRDALSATGTGLLMGQVVDASTGGPVPDAIVTLGGGGLRGQAPGQMAAGRVMVDGQGRFVFRDLPPGTFSLGATKAGYFGGASGQRSPSGPSRPVELGDGERLGDVTLRLWRYGVVSGTVRDDSGAPVTGISVQLRRRTAANGRWQFVSAGSTSTDDRGVYRFGSITPGAYVVSVRSATGAGEQLIVSLLMADEASFMKMISRMAGRGQEGPLVDSSVQLYPTTFYPAATSSSQATVITVTSGAESSELDFRVKSVSARTVAGTVTGIPADASIMLRLTSIDAGSADDAITVSNASANQNGRFAMTGVPPGHYVIHAVSHQNYSPQSAADQAARGRGGPGAPLPAAPDAPTLSATVPVTVGDGNIPDVAIALVPGGRVSGRVEFDGGAERPTPERLNQISVTLVRLEQTGNLPIEQTGNWPIPAGRVETDGTFRTASVPPGRYLLRVAGAGLGRAGGPGVGVGPGAGRGAADSPGAWRAHSAMAGGTELLDQPLDIDAADVGNVVITFTDRPLVRLSGTVRDAKGVGDPEAVILVFPTDSRLWGDLTPSARRIKTARTTRVGAYAIPGLPAGEYFVAVGTDDLLVDWHAPNALESLTPLATRVVIADGQTRTLDLKSGGR